MKATLEGSYAFNADESAAATSEPPSASPPSPTVLSLLVNCDVVSKDLLRFRFTDSVRVLETPVHLTYTHFPSDNRTVVKEYKLILSSIITSNDVVHAKLFIDHMLSDGVPLSVSNNLMPSFAVDMGTMEPEVQKEIVCYAINKIPPGDISFQINAECMRLRLAYLYESEQKWSEAAEVLSGIDLDSETGMLHALGSSFILDHCIRISILYVKADDAVKSSAIFSKISLLASKREYEDLNYLIQAYFARVHDSVGKFLKAALEHYSLSRIEKRQIGKTEISVEQLEKSLDAAIRCTILAAASPRRSLLLAALLKDKRCSKSKIYPILQKVYLERILRKPEIDAFFHQVTGFLKMPLSAPRCWRPSCMRPQSVSLECVRELDPSLQEKFTLLEHAMIEHNLLSVSKLYTSISFDELGTLLGIPFHKAVEIASKMIYEDRLRGSIDQVEAAIYFENDPEELPQLDQQIVGVCESLSDILDRIAKKGFAIPH